MFPPKEILASPTLTCSPSQETESESENETNWFLFRITSTIDITVMCSYHRGSDFGLLCLRNERNEDGKTCSCNYWFWVAFLRKIQGLINPQPSHKRKRTPSLDQRCSIQPRPRNILLSTKTLKNFNFSIEFLSKTFKNCSNFLKYLFFVQTHEKLKLALLIFLKNMLK